MATLQTFNLKSGATLQVQPASFEKGVALIEAVGQAIMGKDPENQFDSAAIFDARVRTAIYETLPFALYETHQMSLELFKDTKLKDRLCGDWFEIASRIVEVNRNYFFPKASSESSMPEEAATKSQR